MTAPWRVWGEATVQRVRLGQSQPAALNAVDASIWPDVHQLPVRGPARDGLPLFDKNAALLRAQDALWRALLEKLGYPRKSFTARVYRTQQATDSIADLDDWIANSLSAEGLAAKPFAHPPVLGVPLWWPSNEAVAFYVEVSVFRPLCALMATQIPPP